MGSSTGIHSVNGCFKVRSVEIQEMETDTPDVADVVPPATIPLNPLTNDKEKQANVVSLPLTELLQVGDDDAPHL